MFSNFTISRKNLAGYILFFGSLLIYVQFIQRNQNQIETQPFFSALMLLFLLRNRFSQIEMIMISIIFYTLSVGLTTYLLYGGNIIDLINYLFGPLIFVATPYVIKINRRLFFTIHFFLIIILILQRFDVYIFSNFLDELFSKFFSRTYSHGESTPISGIAPEPSYFAQQVIFLHLLAEIGFEKKILNISRRELNFFRILLLFYLFLTPSNSLFILILLCFLSMRKKYLIFFIFTIILLLSIRFGTIRFLYLIDNVLKLNLNDFGWDIFFHIDPSGSVRIYKNIIGYLISFESPFGVGPGNYGISWDIAFHNFNIEKFKIHHEIVDAYNSGRKSTTYLSNYGSDIGFIGLLYFFGLISFFLIRLRHSIAQKSTRNVLIFLFFFTCNITNPIPWFLLAIYKKELNLNLQFYPPRKQVIN